MNNLATNLYHRRYLSSESDINEDTCYESDEHPFVLVVRPVFDTYHAAEFANRFFEAKREMGTPTKIAYPPIFKSLGFAVFILLAIGFIGIVVVPNPILELGFPLGFTLWAILYLMMVRFTRHHIVD